MTLLPRILHPLCLTEVMKTKLLALCLFSVISSVCRQQPEPWPFPITGHRSQLEVHPGLMREVYDSAAELSLCKKNPQVKASPGFTVLVCKVLVIELQTWTCFSCYSEAATRCRVQCSSGHRGFQRAWPASSAAAPVWTRGTRTSSSWALHWSNFLKPWMCCGYEIGGWRILMGHLSGTGLGSCVHWWQVPGALESIIFKVCLGDLETYLSPSGMINSHLWSISDRKQDSKAFDVQH